MLLIERIFPVNGVSGWDWLAMVSCAGNFILESGSKLI